MHILHGTWIPESTHSFLQTGAFYLWVEVPFAQQRKGSRSHPGHLGAADLTTFLMNQLGIKEDTKGAIAAQISSNYIALPTLNNQPLPSPELSRYLEAETPDEYETLQFWRVACYEVAVQAKTGQQLPQKAMNVIKFLNDSHFLALHSSDEMQFGSDLLFWYHYTQSFKQVIVKEHYIPALKYRQKSIEKTTKTTKTRAKKSQPVQDDLFEIYATWEIVSDLYESNLKKYVEYMPLICLAG